MDRNAARATFMGGLTVGIFLTGLAFAFLSGHFWTILLVDLAICSLIGSLTTSKIQLKFGAFHGFIFLLGLAVLTLVGFWPWSMVLFGISLIFGSLSGRLVAHRTQARPRQDPLFNYPSPSDPQPQRSYQEGYQVPAQDAYQEGGRQYAYPEQPNYEDAQAQYPQQQQMPPQH